jgi:hypothetical protein
VTCGAHHDQPGTLWARKALNGDYNGDGWPDVLILGTAKIRRGQASSPSCFFPAMGCAILGARRVRFHHGGASSISMEMARSRLTMAGGNSAYFLINDGWQFIRNTNRPPPELQQI